MKYVENGITAKDAKKKYNKDKNYIQSTLFGQSVSNED